jgi:glycosyltransferase involved in cell wall biosynthesis
MPAGPDFVPLAAWDSARRQVRDQLLSILMPAHNLAPVIAGNVRQVRDVFAGQVPFEIVVIDDGSRDGTADELRKLAPEIPELRVVCLPFNSGKGLAIRRGFEASKGRFVAFLDADLDLPPQQLARFFDVMEREKADIVIGSKMHRDSSLRTYPWHRRLFSTVYYSMVKLLFDLPIHDTQTGIKLFRRETLDWVFPRILAKEFAFDLEILAVAHGKGYRIREAPVSLDFQGKLGCVRPRMIRQILTDTLAIFYRLRLLRYYQSIPDVSPVEPAPLVSIVIAYPAETPWLREALDHISRQTYRRFEVVLVPNQSAGHPWEDNIREFPAGPRRPAEKRNIGIAQARGGIVVFLDDDAYPADDWLGRALAYFSDPSVGAVGGPGCTPPGDSYLARISGRIYSHRLVSGSYVYRYAPDRVREVDDYPSCNLFVRADALRELGGFRTDFWPGEDTYLCMELAHRLKKRIVYEPRAVVFHHRRKILLPHLRQIGRYGLHRGHFARRFPQTSRRVAYMIPSVFVAGLVAGGLLSLLLPAVRPLYAAAVGLYLVVTFTASLSRNPLTWLLTWGGIVATHLVYGVQFIAGFFARRLPSEVRPFDHPSEESAA